MKIESSTDFGDLLRHARRNAGLTQEALAERAGISTRAVSDLERGINRTPRRDTLDLLAGALDLSPEERLAWERARRRLAVRSRAATGTTGDSHPSTFHAPTPLTSFVGREREAAEVVEMLRRPGTRLVTLTGPGGVGKTRLALAAAREALDDYPEGIFFINLAPLNDPGLVLPTVARTMNITVPAKQSTLTVLVDALRDRRTLLLLDNVEHVIDAAMEIATLIQDCPSLTILTTSRMPLHLQAEQEYPVSPLEMPGPDEAPGREWLLQFDAVSLFLQRAQSVRRDFQLTDENAPAVVEICHRLDGLPLAIELAAARIRVLTPRSILERLDHPLPILTGGHVDLPLRQQTLRAAIAWSYDLLTPDEQRLFHRLSVFRGGWTLDAAEAVSESGGVLDSVGALVDHSLIRVREGEGGDLRYTMLETIREFGLERLEGAGESDRTYARHCRYFLDLAERSAPTWRTHAEATWSKRLGDDLDNLRAALTWAIDADVELFCRLSGALWRFFTLYGQANEGRRWLEMARSRSRDAAPSVRARILEGAGVCSYLLSDYDAARAFCAEALLLWQATDNLPGEGWMLHGLGRIAYEKGEYLLAEQYYNQSLDVYERAGDLVGIADDLNVLAVVASGVYGDYERARSLYEESLTIRRQVGDRFGIQQSLSNLGETALKTGDYPRARAYFEESLSLSREHRLSGAQSMELRHLGMLALREGDDEQALALLAESIRGFHQARHTIWVVKSLMPLAELAARRGQRTRVAAITGAIEMIATQMNFRVAPEDQRAFERVVADVRCQIDAGEWDAAWARGHAMSLDEAVEYAVSKDAPVPN